MSQTAPPPPRLEDRPLPWEQLEPSLYRCLVAPGTYVYSRTSKCRLYSAADAARGSRPVQEECGPCDRCGAAETRKWRPGPPHMPLLCNACGARFARNRKAREWASPRRKVSPAETEDGRQRDNEEEWLRCFVDDLG